MDRDHVWEIISYAWTEIGIEQRECVELVKKGELTLEHLRDADRIVFGDVRASFAVDTVLNLPLMGMLMPDWGYSEEYLRKRMERWYVLPYWMHLLNPLRWLGYPIAVLMAIKYRSMLRRSVRAKSSTSGAQIKELQ